MPSDATRATAEAMPAISRRRMLLGLAASGTAMTAAAVTKSEAMPTTGDEIEESHELVNAWEQFRDAETEYHAAKDALGWLADEWKHLWPLAPEEILGGANAHTHGAYRDDIERNIIGDLIMRDKAVLTKRLSKEFRAEGGQTCFFIDQPDELTERIKELRQSKPTGRTAKSLERNRKWRKDTIARMETRLRLAAEYHSETQRIREAAGVNAAKQRIKAAKGRIEATAIAVSKIPARTQIGIRLKADALVGYFDYWKLPHNDTFVFGAAWRLADDILGATEHLNGKRSAMPLPTLEGGAI